MEQTNAEYNPEARMLEQLGGSEDRAAEAFYALYDQYAPALYRTAIRHLKSEEMAEDIVQEVFLQVWNKRIRFVHVNNLKSYLYVIAKNLISDQFHKLSAQEQAITEFNERQELTDTEDTVTRKHNYLINMVESLPPRQKEIFTLAKMQGLSHETIAKQLKISRRTVNNHMVEALKYIRKHGDLSLSIGAWLIFFALS